MADSFRYITAQNAEPRQRLVPQWAISLLSLKSCCVKPAWPRMNVLDVGCGTGGLSLIAWKMVGHTGSVTEVDRDETTLGTARALPGDLGQRAVAIVSGALGTAQFPAAFDAVVGRLLLAYPNDPPTLVRQAAAFVRPAGSVDFLALDFSARGSTWPQADEIESSGSAAGPNKTFSARTLRVNSRSARAFETGARIS